MQNCDRIPAISSFTTLLTLTNEFSSLEITKPMDPLNVPDFQVLTSHKYSPPVEIHDSQPMTTPTHIDGK